MKRSHRRHKNPQLNEEQKSTFFSKKNDPGAEAKPFFQRKGLTVGKPGDKYEKEADAMADAVVNNSSPKPSLQQKEISAIQRESLATPLEEEKLGTAEQRMEEDKLVQEKPELQTMGDQEEEEMPLQTQTEEEEEEMPMQAMHEEEEEPQMQKQSQEEEEELPVQTRSQATATSAPTGVSNTVQQSKGKGKPLTPKARAEMESKFGMDFSQVNIHTDQDAVDMNKQLQAQAFTHGKDIYFNSGRYNPETAGGKHLLAHELTHVLQQNKNSSRNSLQTQLYPPVPIVVNQCRRASSGSANPGPGISISYSGKSVVVTANLEISGDHSTPQLAQQFKQAIENHWSGSFSDGYSIQTTVNIRHRPPNLPEDSSRTQIAVYNNPSRALGRVTHMWGPGARTMEYNLAGTDITWSPAHEFGHLLGLDDRYSETWSSIFWGLVMPEGTYNRETEPDTGYENNIMGIDGGVLESKNIRDIINNVGALECNGIGGGSPPMA